MEMIVAKRTILPGLLRNMVMWIGNRRNNSLADYSHGEKWRVIGIIVVQFTKAQVYPATGPCGATICALIARLTPRTSVPRHAALLCGNRHEDSSADSPQGCSQAQVHEIQ